MTKARPNSSPDKLYTHRRWREFRLNILKRDDFTCQMCGRAGTSPELVADHRKPHRGDMALFWDPDNVETLCKTPCHDSRKQSLEKGGDKPLRQAIGADGWPV